jgi:hypothetical protein
MRLEGWIKLEGSRFAREIPEPDQTPFGSTFAGDGEFVLRDMKGGTLPAIGRLDLNEAGIAVAPERSGGDQGIRRRMR